MPFEPGRGALIGATSMLALSAVLGV